MTDLDTLLILYQHDLFATGIARLLAGFGYAIESIDGRQEGAIAEVKALQPRLVLVEDDDRDAVFGAKLGELWAESPNTGVIRIPIQSNQLGVYSARQVTAGGAEDLVGAIKLLIGFQGGAEPATPAVRRRRTRTSVALSRLSTGIRPARSDCNT